MGYLSLHNSLDSTGNRTIVKFALSEHLFSSVILLKTSCSCGRTENQFGLLIYNSCGIFAWFYLISQRTMKEYASFQWYLHTSKDLVPSFWNFSNSTTLNFMKWSSQYMMNESSPPDVFYLENGNVLDDLVTLIMDARRTCPPWSIVWSNVSSACLCRLLFKINTVAYPLTLFWSGWHCSCTTFKIMEF